MWYGRSTDFDKDDDKRKGNMSDEIKSKLIDLVEYVGRMVKLAEKPVFGLKDYRQPFFREETLKDKIGIGMDGSDENGPVWLSVERLKRNEPPRPPEKIAPWIRVGRDPFVPPVVENAKSETVSREKLEEYLEAGLVDSQDVKPPATAEHKGLESIPENRDGAVGGNDFDRSGISAAEAVATNGSTENGNGTGTEERGETLDESFQAILRIERFPDIRAAIDEYLQGPWKEWSETEKPRRETIKIYEAFFNYFQEANNQGAEKPLELVWGMGVARWKHQGKTVDHPIVEQLVEMEIDPSDARLSIRPRGVAPQVFLQPFFDMDIPGAQTVFDFSARFFDEFAEDQELSPFVPETFEPVLRQATTHLDKRGVYFPDTNEGKTTRRLPDPQDHLIVADTWAVYARKRSDNFFVNDLKRLKTAVESAETLPKPAQRLVGFPDEETTAPDIATDPSNANRAESKPGPNNDIFGHSEEFFFPKPFNDEQIEIGKRLAVSDGVVVQGPPGTGKTHTIANMICNCMAMGKRVLVTSKGEAALAVLREHIPESVRELTISLLTNERKGLQQLERAVTILSNTSTLHNERALVQDILSIQQSIASIGERIESIDDELHRWARKHMEPVGGNGGEKGVLPMELAKRVLADRKKYEWFPDRPEEGKDFIPLFSDGDIREIRNARKKLGPDLSYQGKKIPEPSDLPDKDSLASVHGDLLSAGRIERQAEDGELPILSTTAPDAEARAEELLEAVNAVEDFYDEAAERPWLPKLFKLWNRHGFDSDRTRLFDDLIPAMESIAEKRVEVVGHAVEAPDEIFGNAVVCEAVGRACEGRRPFGLASFGKSREKALFKRIGVAGAPPSGPGDWRKVSDYIDWRKQIGSFCRRWANAAFEFALPAMEDGGDKTGFHVSETFRAIEKARAVVERFSKTIVEETPELFPRGPIPADVVNSGDAAKNVAEIIGLNLSKIRLSRSRLLIDKTLEDLGKFSGPVVDAMKNFLKRDIGDSQLGAGEISVRWSELNGELKRVRDLAPDLETVRRIAKSVGKSGAKKWARKLRTAAVENETDPWTPPDWKNAWNWAADEAYIKGINGRDRIQNLFESRANLEKDLKKEVEKVVALRTFLGLKTNMTPRVESALVMFTAAIRRIGKGTGIRAQRFRKDARNAMEQSYSAIPCWIMPTWRISESLPPQLGSFDLVVIDEASQSDIAALPALLRAEKLLVVGDDKQVSPTGAFIEEKKLLNLKRNYLKDQPFAPLMLPGASLYDLANAMFPGKRIMLREHFRCVEPIIRFSMQFYSEEIVPLRIPNSSERIDPPLVDVHVPHGRKNKSKINEAEAMAIVDEVEKLVGDPFFSNRSIGVVSLIGDKQARFIQTRLLNRIGEDAFLKHAIACGDSAAFQGKERDIMFVSMVECPETSIAKTSLVFQQRFNVALSRAKDRMYLFRSVTEEMLNPDDLKAKVLRHFKHPMENGGKKTEDPIGLCESDFEREVFSRLAELGYRTTPQVKAGPYRIDLVVDGANDRRLAVELDGDKYHGPDKWAADFKRQQILERVGWKFWRCWGSSFVIDPDGCMLDLTNKLAGMGIEPAEETAHGEKIYTEHRVVRCEPI